MEWRTTERLAALVCAWANSLGTGVPQQAPTDGQDPAAPASSPHDRVEKLEITAADPAYEGHGHGVTVEYAPAFRGTLHVWTRVDGDFDTFLRVDANSTKRFEDD